MHGSCWWCGPGAFFDGGLAMMVGMLFWAAVLIAAVVLIARAIQTRAGPPPREPPNEAPLDVLKRRLAAGELDVEEYEKRKKLIEQPA